ncbi:MAG TPA: tyrosine--tRNA ligase [Clostridia bacterium]|nr:tyrosine--tRNA ligase [Clostridia bacterium]
MKTNVMDILKERGFIKQLVYEEELYERLGKESVPFYVGFDPTADSLHIGHFVALMGMRHMQQAGHKPIILLGGGTAMIGDPSGRTDMRSMMTKETIDNNIECFRKQISRFLDFSGENAAIMVNNADWLLNLNYVDFLRDIGAHFSVNRMLTAECFKTRLERGLSFLEFNYMLMQAYDFLVLFQKYGCRLQCGGDDQWSNILAGADLIRRKEQEAAYAMTFQLLLTSEGIKMGKTVKGALWLDEIKTTPYEFYQYFRNVDDNDVETCMRLLTFIPLEEINKLTSCYMEKDGVRHYDKAINIAKVKLAFEVTKIVHGEEKAQEAETLSQGAFGDGEEMPTQIIPKGINSLVEIMLEIKVAKSKGEARRLIDGAGVKIDNVTVTNSDAVVLDEDLQKGVVISKGKKTRIKVMI